MALSTVQTDEAIIRHYTERGIYEEIIEEARQHAEDPEHLTINDLSVYDEFHIGGRKATEHLMAQIPFTAGMEVLDIGSGVGGPARFTAENYDVDVTGIDLTPEFCEIATKLSQALGLDQRTSFQAGSALAIPFDDQSFDAAYMIHVGMNISDKAGIYREAYRLLKPGSIFAIYEIFAGSGKDEFTFPVPWAETKDTSFLISSDEITTLLEDAGFEILKKEDRHDFAATALQQTAEAKPVAGKTDPHKRGNLMINFKNGLCGPWEFICKRKQAPHKTGLIGK